MMVRNSVEIQIAIKTTRWIYMCSYNTILKINLEVKIIRELYGVCSMVPFV